ncbi:hypothetical protein A9Q99_07930 [Gammaproteobacteria bacterium 45_16_T64]|nr:hypothetical protein A9Q99_07930 [Gammaproteobacteria bacterium 45_16_T64]
MDCTKDLPWNTVYCNQCALPMDLLENTSDICSDCLQSSPLFSYSRTAFHYQFPIKQLIGAFKEQQNTLAGTLLSQCLVHQLLLDDSLLELPPEILIPVPSHKSSVHKRGYNPAEVVAQKIGKGLSIPVAEHWILKQKKSPKNQKSLPAPQRKLNLQQAFTLSAQGLEQLHKFYRVAIIDDVMTTGSTANAMASLLLGAGVREVIVWAIARTP